MPSYSSGSGFSDSSTYPVQTPENDIINQLSGVAAGLATQMQQWAQGVYAQTSNITNQAVGNFFNVSQKMLGVSDNMVDQYNNVFAPQNRSLAAEANSYNSTERQRIDMGQAGATQAQAGDAARHNAEHTLQGYGVNINDGKYGAILHADEVQNAANVAGAMNTQRNADAATGQRLRSEAVQVGAQLPQAITNLNNTAIQANTGASNASLANANTGANLNRLPNEFLKTAMDVKMPFSGNTSHQENKSSSGPGSGISSNGWPNSPPMNINYGNGGSGLGSGSDTTKAWMPEHGGGIPGMQNFGGGGGGGGGGSRQPGPSVKHYEDDDPRQRPWPPEGPPQPPEDPPIPPPPPEDEGWIPGPITDNDYTSPGMEGSMQIGNEIPWDNNSEVGGSSDYGSGGYDSGSYTDSGGYGGDYYSGGGGGGYDTGTSGGDYYAGDYSAPYYNNDDDYYSMGGAYAQGGAISGPLPPQMSPSGGQQVDDIQAQGPGGSNLRLNAGEFVIPQDVALWKGQEFFQKLIDSSRKLRMTAPAQGGQQGAPNVQRG